ncbi:MAG: MFS transporter [Acidimicrobiales bacterium]|jgi:MFS family permease
MGALRERNFRLYFVGQSTSAVGSAMVPVALAFAILRLTGSAADLGFVLTAYAVSQLIFLLAGGVVADRVPRRLALLGSDVVRFAAEAALATFLLAGRPRLVVILVLVFIQGAASALFMPASSGLVPALVKDAQLQAANSLLQTASSAASIVGPAIAGVLVVGVGPGWAIAADAASYGVSVATLAMLKVARLERGERRRFVADLREGWDEFRSRDWYWKAVVGAGVFNLLFAVYVVLGPVASIRFYSGAKSWAIIATAAGAGSVIGGLLGTRIRSRHPLRVGLPLVTLMSLAPLAVGARLPVAAVAVAAGLGGAGLVVFSSLFETAVQRLVPEAVLSRVLAYDWFGSLLAFPIGLAIAAPLAGAIGIRTVLLVSGVLEIVSIILVLAVRSVWNLETSPVEGAPLP